MSATDLVWGFHRKELFGLKELRFYAKIVCEDLQLLFEAMRDDEPWGAAGSISSIIEYERFIDYPPAFLRYLHQYGHLIDPVAIPTAHPTGSYKIRGLKVPCIPTSPDVKIEPSAHRAALQSGRVFQAYFVSKVTAIWPHHREQMFDAEDVIDDLINDHWREICDELRPVSEFDVDALADAIDKEHQRACDRSRISVLKSVTGAVPGSEQSADSDRGLPPSIAKSVNVPEPRDDGAGGGEGVILYPVPETLARDKWIYENIECNSLSKLQLKLKEIAKREKFVVINSRPGFKNAADRYADYHKLPHRRFRQTKGNDS